MAEFQDLRISEFKNLLEARADGANSCVLSATARIVTFANHQILRSTFQQILRSSNPEILTFKDAARV
jgi:hypothetical protein